MTKKARNAPTAGSSRACSDGENREDKCRNSMPPTESRVSPMQHIHHGYG